MTRAARCIARTLRGFTVKRFGLLCAVVTLVALGHACVVYLMPDKSAADVVKGFCLQFVYMFLLFGGAWVALVTVGNWAPARTGPRVLALFAAAAMGLWIGNFLMGLIMTHALAGAMRDPPTLLKEISGLVLWSHVVGAGVLGYFFFTREEETVARLHEEDMRREALDRELAEARLSVMQAQVEPHFLFNTLANVRRLFQTDPEAARAMLEHLSRYLGAMLPRMRRTDSTLGHEVALALAYLSVQQIRMGPRLTVRTDIPETLNALPFPPMMLVTLVENAIRHGLNPLPEGGEIRIQARTAEGRLRLQVQDTGAGLSESTGPGVGLANIRARLNTLYGGDARLLLAQNPGTGVIATIEVPAEAPRTAQAA